MAAFFLIPGAVWSDSNPDFEVQAHRGGRALRPENTLAAFAHAVELGVDTLEMDLAVTNDRVVVVSHDYRLNPLLTRNRYLLPESVPVVAAPLDLPQ